MWDKMKEFIESIVVHFRRDHGRLSDEMIREFMRVLETVRLEDIPCREAFARLDEYVERELQGEEAARLMPLLREHLDLCPDCCEEYEALLDAVSQSSRRNEGKGSAAASQT